MISLSRMPNRRASSNQSLGFAVIAMLAIVAPLACVSQVQAQSGTSANFSDQAASIGGQFSNSGFAPSPAAGGQTFQQFQQAPVYQPTQQYQPQFQQYQPQQYQQFQTVDSPVYQSVAQVAPAEMEKKKFTPGKSHKVVFYANDFSYLTDPAYEGPRYLGDAFKGIGPRGNLDIGGQLRLRYNSENSLGQQAGATRFQDTQNDFLLGRLRLYADWKITDRIRVYVEGIYADVLTQNSEYIPRGIDINQGDLQNAFVDLQITDNATVRAGRQELLFGSQRVISPLDWANTRRTFQGVRLLQRFEDVNIDWFYTQIVDVAPTDFDDANEDNEFFGFYSSFKNVRNSTLDLYALGSLVSTGSPADRSTVTFGSRINGSRNQWLWDFEGAVQTGSFDSGGDIEAGFWTAGLGRSFENLAWKPKLWFYYDFATGDRADGDTQSFNELFPLGHKYLGFTDSVQRNNIKSPNIFLTAKPRDRLTFIAWYHNFQAAEEEDTILSLGGTPAQDLTTTDFGNEIDLLLNFQATPRSNIIAGYSHFFVGDRIIGGEDADFFYLTFQQNF